MNPARNTVSALADTPAQPLDELAAELKLPASTMSLLRARGQGPKCFKLGRRLYVSQQAKLDWIASMERETSA